MSQKVFDMDAPAQVDYLGGGGGGGSVAAKLLANNMNVYALKPFLGKNGRPYISQPYVTNDGSIKYRPVLVGNDTAAMPRDVWAKLDEKVLQVAKPRLRVFGDLRARGLEYVIPNGMGRSVFMHQRMTDITEASISMSPVVQGQSDRPGFDLLSQPLPIISKDFQFDIRQLTESRNGGAPLDTTGAALASRRVAEQVERLTIGTYGSYQFGGGTVYGLTNFPNRITSGASTTLPTTGGWSGATLLGEVLNLIQLAQQHFFFGPFKLYYSLAWDKYMNNDYNLYKGLTLRQRLEQIESIDSCEVSDYLASDYQIVLVQQSEDVMRAVVGQEITTVQWETMGGMLMNFKVLCIMVPQPRCDINNNCGIVHSIAA